MTHQNRQTTDPDQIHRFIERLFLRLPVKLRDKSGEYPIKVLQFDGTLLSISKPERAGGLRLLVVSHKEHQILAECKVMESGETDIERLKPTKLHIRPKVRQEERVQVRGGECILSSCLTQNSIPERLGSMNKKREAITQIYKNAFEERLPPGAIVNIILRKSGRLDHRMRPMQQQYKAIFAPHMKEKIKWATLNMGNFLSFTDYEKVLRYDDIPKVIISEVCEPLWFHSLYLYGYVQVFLRNMLTEENYDIISKLTRQLEVDFVGHDCLPKNRNYCRVLDINHQGLSFLHPHAPRVLKDFMPGESIIFDLYFTNDIKASFTGVIKNIKSEEKAHRFGVQLDPMTPDRYDILDEYLKSLKNTETNTATPPEPPPTKSSESDENQSRAS